MGLVEKPISAILGVGGCIKPSEASTGQLQADSQKVQRRGQDWSQEKSSSAQASLVEAQWAESGT